MINKPKMPDYLSLSIFLISIIFDRGIGDRMEGQVETARWIEEFRKNLKVN